MRSYSDSVPLNSMPALHSRHVRSFSGDSVQSTGSPHTEVFASPRIASLAARATAPQLPTGLPTFLGGVGANPSQLALKDVALSALDLGVPTADVRPPLQTIYSDLAAELQKLGIVDAAGVAAADPTAALVGQDTGLRAPDGDKWWWEGGNGGYYGQL